MYFRGFTMAMVRVPECEAGTLDLNLQEREEDQSKQTQSDAPDCNAAATLLQREGVSGEGATATSLRSPLQRSMWKD